MANLAHIFKDWLEADAHQAAEIHLGRGLFGRYVIDDKGAAILIYRKGTDQPTYGGSLPHAHFHPYLW